MERPDPSTPPLTSSPESIPNFRQGQRRIWIAAALVVLVGVAAVLALSGVFERKGKRIIVEEPDYKEGGTGCPCGCDRSETMAAELRGRPKDEALGAIDKSLATIAEREAAGYITERMVRHRLRLLDLERETLQSETLSASPHTHLLSLAQPISTQEPAIVSDAGLSVKMDLIVHGDTTEWVDHRQKPLAACFVLRMEIENLAGQERKVKKPAIAGDVSFPISRWYLNGGAGAHWDGQLKAHDKASVHAIGYVTEGLSPGTKVDATVRFESFVAHMPARARARWNEQ